MDFSFMLNGAEKQKVEMQVNSFNKALNGGREMKQEMGKDDFLQLLITQLTHQDPTQPMGDKEFIAQMVQFSTLEQMTNMSEEFARLSGMIAANQAMGLLGRTVEISDGSSTVTGVVEEVSGGDFPQLLVQGEYYDYEQVSKVME